MEGLANTIKPSVRTRGVYQRQRDSRLIAFAVIVNVSQWDATDVTVKVRRRDDRVFDDSKAWLRPEGSADRLEIEIGEIDTPTLGGYEFLVVADIVIRFKDDRRIGSYECVEDYSSLTEPPGAPEVTERRLSIGK
jgi:hypothetical protein